MSLLDKVLVNENVCGIELAFKGNVSPSSIAGWQPFYNSIFDNTTDFEKAYATLGSIDFDEESIDSPAGISFKQKAIFRFPENDSNRSERIELIHKIKFLKFNFTNGLDLVIGRNDFYQNAFPIIKTKSNGKLCEVSLESVSIFPAAFSPKLNRFGLPTFTPITLNP